MTIDTTFEAAEPATSSPSRRPSINALVRQSIGQVDISDGLPLRPDNRTLKTLRLLARCRQGDLGASQHHCADCGHREVTLHACNDRHCPQCAKQSRYVWEKQVLDWSLDCDYLHLVVTLPHELNPLIAANPGPLLRLLHATARDAVLGFARQHGVAEPGLIVVLHTWGQRLNYHFHAHVVMTAGGLSADGTQWVKFDQDQVAADNVALAERFKKIYLRRLKKMLRERLFSEITQTEVIEDFSYQSKGPLRYPLQQPDQASIEAMLSIIKAKKWVADIGVTPERFRERGERRNAMRYVGAYVAGSAIGDGRLVSAQGDTVKFRAFDYRTDQYIELEMTKVDFVEAYARHILPARLRRFRFAGLFRPKGRTARLRHCRKLLGSVEAEPAAPLMPPQDDTPAVHVIPAEAPEKAPEETTLELKHGLFCSKCAQRMTRVIEIDGSMSCWMLKVALLVVAYLNTQRLAPFSLTVDRELIKVALQQVLARLQAEATITEAEVSREWMRYAHVTPGELFFHEAYYEVMLLFIAQQIAEQNAAEERMAEAMLSPAHHAARGPPKRNDSEKKDGVHPR
jgi:hypothetical protein